LTDLFWSLEWDVAVVVVDEEVVVVLDLLLSAEFTADINMVVEVVNDDFSLPPPFLAATPNFLDVLAALEFFSLAVLDFFFPMVVATQMFLKFDDVVEIHSQCLLWTRNKFFWLVVVDVSLR
jgi:hypothetical protein